MTKTTTIHGRKIRTGSTRRFVVVSIRPGYHPSIEARSDSWATIRGRAAKVAHAVIWDTVTGEHFDWAGRPLG